MRKLKVSFSAVLFLALSGCSWFQSASVQGVLKSVELGGCKAETNAISAAAVSISNTLQCANVAAVQASITSIVGNLNICKLVPPAGTVQIKGVLANTLCPLVASGVIGGATMLIPSAWGCAATVAADQVQAALISACELIPY